MCAVGERRRRQSALTGSKSESRNTKQAPNPKYQTSSPGSCQIGTELANSPTRHLSCQACGPTSLQLFVAHSLREKPQERRSPKLVRVREYDNRRHQSLSAASVRKTATCACGFELGLASAKRRPRQLATPANFVEQAAWPAKLSGRPGGLPHIMHALQAIDQNREFIGVSSVFICG